LATYRCGSCGANWSAGEFARTAGNAGVVCLSTRASRVAAGAARDSWDFREGHWAGRCALPEEEQRPYNDAAGYHFLIRGFLDDVYSLERFERLYREHLDLREARPGTMRADIRARILPTRVTELSSYGPVMGLSGCSKAAQAPAPAPSAAPGTAAAVSFTCRSGKGKHGRGGLTCGC